MSYSTRSVLSLSLLLAQAMMAQEPVIKTTTRLVQLSVIARSHDQPAEGLTKEDFKVFVDGHEQKISFFSSVSALTKETAAPAPALPSNTFSNILATKGQAPTAVTVVLLDLINTRLTDRISAQQQMIKYLQSIPVTDRVAVYVFNGRLQVLHDYTSNMELFQQRLAAAKGQIVSVTNTEQAGAIDTADAGAFAEFVTGGGGGGAERAFYMRDRVLGTLNVLKFVASHLANVPGRKNLVWLSSAFPLRIGGAMSKFAEQYGDEFDATVRALSDANVAVYPVDARGLTTSAAYDASRFTPMTAANGKTPMPPRASVSGGQTASQGTMQELAQATGGHAYINTNDLAHAIDQAVEDSALTYTLGFYPEEEKQDREFHKLKVEVDKPHINLHYRNGYLDLAEVPKDDKTRSIQLHDALWSPLDATEIGLTVRLAQANTAAIAANSLSLEMALDAKGIRLDANAERHTGRVDILLAQFNKDGSVLGTPAMQTVQLNMQEATFRKFLASGLNLNDPVNLSAGASSLRVIVRDYGSGMIGSVTVPLNGSL